MYMNSFSFNLQRSIFIFIIQISLFVAQTYVSPKNVGIILTVIILLSVFHFRLILIIHSFIIILCLAFVWISTEKHPLTLCKTFLKKVKNERFNRNSSNLLENRFTSNDDKGIEKFNNDLQNRTSISRDENLKANQLENQKIIPYQSAYSVYSLNFFKKNEKEYIPDKRIENSNLVVNQRSECCCKNHDTSQNQISRYHEREYSGYSDENEENLDDYFFESENTSENYNEVEENSIESSYEKETSYTDSESYEEENKIIEINQRGNSSGFNVNYNLNDAKQEALASTHTHMTKNFCDYKLNPEERKIIHLEFSGYKVFVICLPSYEDDNIFFDKINECIPCNDTECNQNCLDNISNFMKNNYYIRNFKGGFKELVDELNLMAKGNKNNTAVLRGMCIRREEEIYFVSNLDCGLKNSNIRLKRVKNLYTGDDFNLLILKYVRNFEKVEQKRIRLSFFFK